MGKRVLTDNRLVPLDLHASDTRHQTAGRKQLVGIHPGVALEIVSSRRQGHHNLFQRRISSTFTQPVDRALDLTSPLTNSGQAVGHGQPQVVVAMRTEYGLTDVRHILFEVSKHRTKLCRRSVPDCIWNIDRRGPGLDRFFDHLAQKVQLGSRRILRRKLHILTIIRRPLDHLHSRLDDLFLVHLQLVFHVDGTCREEHVESPSLGVLQRPPRPVDILLPTSRQPANRRSIAELARDHLDSLKISGRGNGKPRFNNIDPQVNQRTGNLEFLRRLHAAAGRLLAIPQRRVEDRNRVGRHWFESTWTRKSLVRHRETKNPRVLPEGSGFVFCLFQVQSVDKLSPPTSRGAKQKAQQQRLGHHHFRATCHLKQRSIVNLPDGQSERQGPYRPACGDHGTNSAIPSAPVSAAPLSSPVTGSIATACTNARPPWLRGMRTTG